MIASGSDAVGTGREEPRHGTAGRRKDKLGDAAGWVKDHARAPRRPGAGRRAVRSARRPPTLSHWVETRGRQRCRATLAGRRGSVRQAPISPTQAPRGGARRPLAGEVELTATADTGDASAHGARRGRRSRTSGTPLEREHGARAADRSRPRCRRPVGSAEPLRDELRELHRVERGALAQVVVRDEQHEAPARLGRLVGADASDERRRRCRRPASGVGTSTSSTPGASREQLAGLLGLRSRSNSAWIASECPVNTGTRTHVPATRSSGRSRILRDSLRSFCSSSVSAEPSSTIEPASGSTLCAMGAV